MRRPLRLALVQVTDAEAEAIRSAVVGDSGLRVRARRLDSPADLGGGDDEVSGADLVVIGHAPPEGDARPWLDRFRVDEATVVVLTGDGGLRDLRALRRAGAFAVVRRDWPRRLGRAVRLAAGRAACRAIDADFRQLSGLIGLIGHNLRDVLGGIDNAVEVLRFQAGDRELAQRRTIDFLAQQCRRMAGLLDDYGEVARLDPGPAEPSPEVVELGSILGRALERARFELGQASACFELITPAEPIWLRTDSRRLEQLARHAALSCWRARRGPEPIRIGYRAGTDRVELRFESPGGGPGDAGPVAPASPADLDFYLARTLAERLGGRVRPGPALVVELPNPTARTPESSPGKAPSVGEGSERLAVLVDDNPASVQALGLLIGRLGWSVRVTPDTSEAMSMIRALRPGVVLIDLHMPVMDGRTLALAIRRELPEPTPLLIGITGSADTPDPGDPGMSCFDYFLPKPVRREQIAALLPEPGTGPEPPA